MPTSFTPRSSKHQGALCHGIQIQVINREEFDPLAFGYHLVQAIYRLYPGSFQWRLPHFDRLCGTDQVRKAIEAEDAAFEAPPKHLISTGFAAAALGASWIALAVLAISVLFVGRYGEALIMAALSGALALLFKRVFRWHLERQQWSRET